MSSTESDLFGAGMSSTESERLGGGVSSTESELFGRRIYQVPFYFPLLLFCRILISLIAVIVCFIVVVAVIVPHTL